MFLILLYSWIGWSGSARPILLFFQRSEHRTFTDVTSESSSIYTQAQITAFFYVTLNWSIKKKINIYIYIYIYYFSHRYIQHTCLQWMEEQLFGLNIFDHQRTERYKLIVSIHLKQCYFLLNISLNYYVSFLSHWPKMWDPNISA